MGTFLAPRLNGMPAALNIRFVLVPADESLDGKGVPEIVHTGVPPLFIPDAGGIKKQIDRISQSGMAIGANVTVIAVT
jgi:hypothetical protein